MVKTYASLHQEYIQRTSERSLVKEIIPDGEKKEWRRKAKKYGSQPG